MSRILVCGSRSFGSKPDHHNLLNWRMFLHVCPGSRIIHGGQMTRFADGTKGGADYLAGEWAKKNGFEVYVYEANWKDFGKAAGPLRNSAMLNADIDFVIAFWDGKSPGTRDTITKARAMRLPVHVYEYT